MPPPCPRGDGGGPLQRLCPEGWNDEAVTSPGLGRAAVHSLCDDALRGPQEPLQTGRVDLPVRGAPGSHGGFCLCGAVCAGGNRTVLG